jgi:hypothetical protein
MTRLVGRPAGSTQRWRPGTLTLPRLDQSTFVPIDRRGVLEAKSVAGKELSKVSDDLLNGRSNSLAPNCAICIHRENGELMGSGSCDDRSR